MEGAALVRQCIGGPDGVTGANQFQARTLPDGGTALLLPGAASLSWLTGDARVRFDAGNWLPLWGASCSLALASRVPLSAARPLRLAVRSVVGPDLAGMLALDLAGLEVVPVAVTGSGPRLLERPDLDVVLLRGTELHSPALPPGWRLAASFGSPGPNGELVPDPSLPDLPILKPRAQRDRPAELALALNAVVAAAKLDVALVLPRSSPAAVVAWWRRSCTLLATAADVQSEATRTSVQPLGSGHASACLEAIVVDPPVLLELRRWLSDRYKWRPT